MTLFRDSHKLTSKVIAMFTSLAPEGPPPLVLEPNDQAPRLARGFVAERFAGWGIKDDYVGRLVVCELVTNAYRHGGGPIVVRVLRDECDGLPVIEVWDGGEGRPVVRPQDYAAVSGRGLQLMAEIVHEWGVRPLNEGGNVVWAGCGSDIAARAGPARPVGSSGAW